MIHFVRSPASGLLRVVVLGLGAFAGCGTVSEDPLVGGNGGTAGKAGAVSDGGASDPTANGSGNEGGRHRGEPLDGSGDGNGDDASGGDGDGSGDGGSGSDNEPVPFPQGGAGEGGQPGRPNPLRRCSSTAPFWTPQRIPGLPEGAIRLRLNPEETVGHYALLSDTGTSFDLEVSTRTSRLHAFSAGTLINTNDGGWDFSPTLPSDGSILYFERRNENLVWRLHQAVWHPEQQAFGPVDLVPGLGPGAGNHSDGGPYVTASGDVLYFHSNRSGNGLFRATRVGTSFSQVTKVPMSLPESLSLTVAFPVVTPDELTLYFVGHESTGPSDIFRATRETIDEGFGEPARVVEVSTANDNEVPSFISEDGCRLYFDRNSNVPFSWNPPVGNAFVAEREPDSE